MLRKICRKTAAHVQNLEPRERKKTKIYKDGQKRNTGSEEKDIPMQIPDKRGRVGGGAKVNLEMVQTYAALPLAHRPRRPELCLQTGWPPVAAQKKVERRKGN